MAKKISGSPIYGKSNLNCEYVQIENASKKDSPKFDECTCPVRKYVMRQNNLGSIIRCAADFNQCLIYSAQNKKHINLIEAYVNKYSADGWLNVPEKHIEILIQNKLQFGDEKYLLDLFNFFGYNKTDDEKVEGLLLTKFKVQL